MNILAYSLRTWPTTEQQQFELQQQTLTWDGQMRLSLRISLTLSNFLHFSTRARAQRRSVEVGNWFSKLTLLSLSGSYFQPSKRKASKNLQTVGCDLIRTSAWVPNVTTLNRNSPLRIAVRRAEVSWLACECLLLLPGLSRSAISTEAKREGAFKDFSRAPLCVSIIQRAMTTIM